MIQDDTGRYSQDAIVFSSDDSFDIWGAGGQAGVIVYNCIAYSGVTKFQES